MSFLLNKLKFDIQKKNKCSSIFFSAITILVGPGYIVPEFPG